MKKLIIFDCDGVLINTEIIASRVQAAELTKIGFPITTEELIHSYTGIEEATTRQMLRARAPLELSEDFFTATSHSITNAVATEITALIPTVLQFVSSNMVCCVASNSSNAWVIKNLVLTKQMEFFKVENIFTASQVKKGKPAPDLFLFAASQMGFAPKDCLVVEDSAIGVQAAQAANMDVVGFLGAEHAKYPWYKERLDAYDIPLAHTAEELLSMLQMHALVECL